MIDSTASFFNWVFEDKPSDTSIVICHLNKGIKDGKEFTYWVNQNAYDAENAAFLSEKNSKLGKDVFYGISLFKDNLTTSETTGRAKVGRLKKMTAGGRVLICDIDCGGNKDYPDWSVALKDAVATLNKLKLDPKKYTVVKSGGGLHIYIRLTKYAERTEWERVAAALKSYYVDSGLKIDPSKTTDVALVLRPIGTFNYKNTEPRAVELLHHGGEDVDIEYLSDLLKDHLPAKQDELPPIDTPILPLSVMAEQLTPTQEVVKWKDVESACQQIKFLAEDCNVPEALWYSALGVAAYTDSPEEAAIAWSRNYHGFNEKNTLQKMAHWVQSTTGPATCQKIKDLNPEGCSGCAYKVKTPIQAVKFHKQSQPKVFNGEADKPVILPPGYTIINGSLYHVNEDLKKLVCKTIIYVDSISRFGDIRQPETYLKLKLKLPREKWGFLEIKYNDIGSSRVDTLAAVLGNAGVPMQPTEVKNVKEYLINAYIHYEENQDVAKVSTQMGWTTENSFIYGGLELRGSAMKPESVTPQGSSMVVMSKTMTPKGNMDAWLNTIRMISAPGFESIAFGYLVGYGALVFKFLGLGGAVINFYSEDSGSGKSTACRLAMSIYGNPDKLMGTKTDTETSTMSKLSCLNNLPYFIDEISDMKSDIASNLLYTVACGKEKSRSDKTGEVRDSREWNLMLLVSSNKSLYDKLDEHTQSAAGQKARLIEINLNKNEMIDTHGRNLNLLINSHHGHAGTAFINELVDIYNQGTLEQQVQDAQKEFCKYFAFDFLPVERFIASAISSTWFAAKIAKDLGFCPGFNLDRIFQNVLDTIERNRNKLVSSVPDVEQVIWEFMSHMQDKCVKYVTYVMPRDVIQASAPRGEIFGRLNMRYRDKRSFNPEHCDVAFSSQKFKTFCSQNKYPYHAYLDKIRDMRGFVEKNVNITSGIIQNQDGIPIPPIRLKCLCFHLPANVLDKIENVTREEEEE